MAATKITGKPATCLHVAVAGVIRGIATVEALAAVLGDADAPTMAVPASGLLMRTSEESMGIGCDWRQP